MMSTIGLLLAFMSKNTVISTRVQVIVLVLVMYFFFFLKSETFFSFFFMSNIACGPCGEILNIYFYFSIFMNSNN